MGNLANFQKILRLYRDHPYLWQIQPTVRYDLDVQRLRPNECPLEEPIVPGDRWWVFCSTTLMQTIREVTPFDSVDLKTCIRAATRYVAVNIFCIISARPDPELKMLSPIRIYHDTSGFGRTIRCE